MPRTTTVNGRTQSVNGRTVGGTGIPDSDLTQYSEEDPDNSLTINSSSEYVADLNNGANAVARLYKSIDLSGIDNLIYSCDFTVTSYTEFAELHIGLADAANDVDTSTIGCTIGDFSSGSSNGLEIHNLAGDTGSDQITVAGLSTNTSYSVDLIWDFVDSTISVDLFDSNDNQIGSESQSYSASLSHHYALQSGGKQIVNEGEIEMTLTNPTFATP